MAKFRKVSTVIWNDAKFRTLSDRGQLVFFFILTHPHLTPLGAMRGTIPGLAAEMGHWPEKAFREAFREAFAKGLIEHDEKACFIALPNFLKHNQPESPNVVKSWDKCWGDIPECKLKEQLRQRVKGFTEALPKAFREALPEAFAKGMPNQEQEQEQGQEQEQEQDICCVEPESGSRQEDEETSYRFPLSKRGSEWSLPASMLDEFTECYPGVDIARELLAAKAWLVANPSRRKTSRGMARFLNAWLGRVQDRGGSQASNRSDADPRGNFAALERYASNLED